MRRTPYFPTRTKNRSMTSLVTLLLSKVAEREASEALVVLVISVTLGIFSEAFSEVVSAVRQVPEEMRLSVARTSE